MKNELRAVHCFVFRHARTGDGGIKGIKGGLFFLSLDPERGRSRGPQVA